MVHCSDSWWLIVLIHVLNSNISRVKDDRTRSPSTKYNVGCHERFWVGGCQENNCIIAHNGRAEKAEQEESLNFEIQSFCLLMAKIQPWASWHVLPEARWGACDRMGMLCAGRYFLLGLGNLGALRVTNDWNQEGMLQTLWKVDSAAWSSRPQNSLLMQRRGYQAIQTHHDSDRKVKVRAAQASDSLLF